MPKSHPDCLHCIDNPWLSHNFEKRPQEDIKAQHNSIILYVMGRCLSARNGYEPITKRSDGANLYFKFTNSHRESVVIRLAFKDMLDSVEHGEKPYYVPFTAFYKKGKYALLCDLNPASLCSIENIMDTIENCSFLSLKESGAFEHE